jgi:hypothetical protein
MRKHNPLSTSKIGQPSHRCNRPNPTYHRIKCCVCKHPARIAIDDALLHWQSPKSLARTFGIPDRSSLYRHARATGLFSRRRKDLSSALDSIIGLNGSLIPRAAKIVMHANVHSQFNCQGQWIQPPKRRIGERVNAASRPQHEINRHTKKTESDASD